MYVSSHAGHAASGVVVFGSDLSPTTKIFFLILQSASRIQPSTKWNGKYPQIKKMKLFAGKIR